MSMRWIHAFAAAAILAMNAIPAAAAVDYPNRTITMVVPFSGGGPTDVLARIFARNMSQTLGQQIVIENIAGANGSIGTARVAKADPDGYTMVMGNLGTHAAAAGLANLHYDPRTDFEPVILAASAPMVLVTRKDLGVNTLKEFIALAKTRRLTFGSTGVGSISHLAYLLFSKLTGLDIRNVDYPGLPQVADNLLAGRIDFTFDQVISATPHIMSGEVKPIVLCQPTGTPNLPDVPSSTEAGLPGLQTTAWSALFLPKGTPKAIVDRINAAAVAAMRDAEVKRRLDDLSAEIPPSAERTPAALGKLVHDAIAKWVPLIQSAEKATAK
jgi:tripartite-type tricarboxylate transporter receptor subunit TctC